VILPWNIELVMLLKSTNTKQVTKNKFNKNEETIIIDEKKHKKIQHSVKKMISK
jgi:hypothetical protein